MTKEELLKDWFSDRSGRFVVEPKTGRICWEDNLNGTGIAEAFTASKIDNQEELLKKAYCLAKETITAMNPAQPIRISVGGGESYSSTTHIVNIATNYFDDKRLSPEQMAEIFIGLTAHEGSHVLYTDMGTAFDNDTLVSNLCNILEDERIERCLAKERAGLMGFIAAVKNYYFDRAFPRGEKPAKDELVKRFLNLLLAFIRYPKEINQEDLDRFLDYMIKVREVLTPYPTSTAECLAAAKKIRKIIDELIKKEKEEQQKKRSQNNAQNEKSSDGKSNSSQSKSDTEDSQSHEQEDSESGNSPNEDNSPSESDNSQGESNSEDSQSSDNSESESNSEESESNKDENSESETSGQEKGSNEEESPEESEQNTPSNDKQQNDSSPQDEDSQADLSESSVTKQIKDFCAKVSQTMHQEVDTEDMCEQLRYNEALQCEVEQKVLKGTFKGTYIFKGKPYKETYLSDLKIVKPLIPVVSRAICGISQEMTLHFTGLRSGSLDTHRLAQAVQGVPNVYYQKHVQESNRIAVCLLVDESGSMSEKDSVTKVRRYVNARRTAILLYEALRKCKNIDTYIYGHSTSEFLLKSGQDSEECPGKSVDIYSYIENNRGDRFTLGGIDWRGSNVDGVAISEVASRVRSHTSLPCIMFVIADGMPWCSIEWCNKKHLTPEDHVRECVEKISKDGFYPIQICMDRFQQPETMFRHYLTFSEDMHDLPKKLSKLFKSTILKNMKRSIR